MSDVVVNVVESATNVTVTEQDVAVDVTETVVEVSVSTAGIQGVPGANNDPTYVTVRNATGATLAKGTIVYISGANGNHVQVTPAIATSDATSARTLGWLSASIANNASGLCMVEGYLEGLNTQSFNAGDQLYLSGTVAGGFTATKPQAPIHLVYVGVVTKKSAGDGHVFVKVQNGYELNEIHDVQITSIANNDVIKYDSATSLWKNVGQSTLSVGTAVYATTSGSAVTITGSITKSQVSDFTSGTVASAGTAQQAGTAVYAVNSGTAIYATTSGTALTITGSITKSQVSDFTSGTVASATTAGTSVYATNSGTAVYSTTSGTALTITGDITKSQVSDFTSGTVTSASTAQQAGTAVYAVNSGTAVTISGSITQSQVTNLVSDLANTAKTNANNTFANTNAFNAGSTFNNFLSINSADGNGAGSIFTTGEAGGLNKILIAGSRGNGGVIIGSSAAVLDTTVLAVRGATTQNGNLTEWRTNAGTILSRISSSGQLVSDQQTYIGSGATSIANTRFNVATGSASVIGAVIRGAASQTANLQEWQNSAGTILARMTSAGVLRASQVLTLNGLASMGEFNNGAIYEFVRATAQSYSPGANRATMYFRDGTVPGTLKLVVRAGAAGAETTILDNIPQ